MSMRNNAATVQDAVKSVQLQTLGDWELVVIDDGSADASSSIVSAFDDPRIRLVRESSSAGLATRLNQAVALSRGEFIARMDADDLCFPDRLAQQVARLQQEGDIDVLAGGAVVFATDAQLLGELPVGLTHEDITAHPLRGFPFPHPTWCGRAQWFRQNPYDSKLMKAQDQDLLLRTFKSSRFAALDEVLIGYRQNGLELAKMLSGRWVYIASLWRHAQRSGEWLPALQGITAQLLKAGADIATVGLGLNQMAQRQRLRPVRPAVTKRWQELRRQLCLTGNAV
jgi:glycosyltransferase involved in cell wall biosynthesis